MDALPPAPICLPAVGLPKPPARYDGRHLTRLAVLAVQLAREGVDEIFTTSLRSGAWTCGLRSLPPEERTRGVACTAESDLVGTR